MTYTKWSTEHVEKLEVVLDKLEESTIEEIVDYFDYDNMVELEPSFCPLYRNFTKCHITNKLNCLLCSCPHFQYSDDKPIEIVDNIKVMSICNIKSKQAHTYTTNNIQHCDCSKCLIPHNKHYVNKSLDNADVIDNYSLLEWVRSYQISNIFGKIKKGEIER